MESSKTLKLLINMNNYIIFLNRQVHELWFFAPKWVRHSLVPRPKNISSEVDCGHF